METLLELLHSFREVCQVLSFFIIQLPHKIFSRKIYGILCKKFRDVLQTDNPFALVLKRGLSDGPIFGYTRRDFVGSHRPRQNETACN